MIAKARKLWGTLVNNSRNFAIKLSVILNEPEDRAYFRKMIPNSAAVFHQHLSNDETRLQFFDDVDLEIDHHKHKPNQIATLLF